MLQGVINLKQNHSMAIVTSLKASKTKKIGKQSEVNCGYRIINNENGEYELQIETYRSSDTSMEGDPTQIIKFSGKAVKQLAKILFNDILLK